MYVYQTCGSSLVFHFILMNQERTQVQTDHLFGSMNHSSLSKLLSYTPAAGTVVLFTNVFSK